MSFFTDPILNTRVRRLIVALGICAMVAGCETHPVQTKGASSSVLPGAASLPTSQVTAVGTSPSNALPPEAVPSGTTKAPLSVSDNTDYFRPGSGQYLRRTAMPQKRQAGSGKYTLNFENTDIHEVVKVVLGDLLQQNYVVDPRIQGNVTLQTSQALPVEDLLPTLELLLRMNGAALVDVDDLYSIVPLEGAVKGRTMMQLGDSNTALPQGFGIRIVPLRFIAVAEMQKILEPISNPSNVIRIDQSRNLLIIAGPRQELDRLIDTIRIFDVDWLEGMSMALFRPSHVEAKVLVEELDKVFGNLGTGPLAGLVRIVPIDRLNALLAVTPRPEYLKKVAEWVDRLDQNIGEAGRRLYVYHVQNGKASELAEVLGQVFDKQDREARTPSPKLAPGLQPVEISSKPDQAEAASAAGDVNRTGVPPARKDTPSQHPPGAGEGVAISEGGSVRIIADEVNNALLVMATAQEYRQVLAALRKLDIVPLQVLIEATIAEIQLTDELQYGLEWFFKNNLKVAGGAKIGQGTLDLGDPGIAALTPGFSYAIVDGAHAVRAVLNTLAAESKVNIVSSPSLMVLNNQTARINIGDQIPIVTQSQQATDANATVVNTIEYRDTGVLLTVMPRVNAGGLVTMEIKQEVSELGTEDFAGGNPSILQRQIESTVAIHSAQTVVLGGLIREKRTNTESGIPGLHQLPLVGALFGTKGDDRARTELVVLITPRVVQDARQAQDVTEEFRRKMLSLKPLQDASRKSSETSSGGSEQ